MKLLTVKELQARIAAAEGAKASAALKAMHAEEEEKRALLEQLTKPSGLSDEEIMEKASIIINRAVENGQMSVQVFRFPHSICTDNGRAINQAEAGWEKTLDRHSQGDLRVLEAPAPAARLSYPLRDHQLSRRHAGRHRHHPELGLRSGRYTARSKCRQCASVLA